MAKYRIVEWDERYECDDKGGVWVDGHPKRVGPLKFIREKVHGKSQGLGWRTLIRVAGKRRAPSVFGIFQKLKELAADEEAGKRGVILSADCPNLQENITPLSFVLGLDQRDIDFALNVLCTIGWMRVIDSVPENSRNSSEFLGIPNQISPVQSSSDQYSTVHTHTGSVSPESVSLFDQFWSAYPKKKAKDAARRAFAKRKPSEALLATMLAAIEAQKQTEDWQKENGRYIPYPASWLNGGRWEDHIGPVEVEETPEQISERLHAKGIL